MSSREGIIEEFISLLLKQLADVKRKNGSPTSEVQKQLLGEIENEVRVTKDIFCRVRLWERDVTDEFGAVAKHIDDILEDGGSDFQSKLEGIEQQILKIKELVTPPLKLPPVESSTRSPSSSSGPSTTTTTDQFHIMSGEWRQFELDDKILESSAMTNLQVSYDNLGIQLKLCLLCFSVFPENSVIKRRPLIYWWIGEGMVTPTRSNTAEEVGGGCFRELIYKGLIEPIYRKHSPVVDRCRMHPWIRRMLISVARKARFFDFDSEGNPTSDAFGSRRACLVGTERQGSAPQRPGLGAAQSNPEELLTLFNVNEHYLRLGKDWFAELRKVAVLQLGRWQTSAKHHIEVEDMEFLKGLGSCEHLIVWMISL